MSDDDLNDLSWSAYEEAMAFGLNRDVFLRYFKTVRNQCQLSALNAQEPQGEAQQPVAWVRFCSDGTIEGPLLNGQIDEVRKKSGAWTPLVAQQQESRKPLTEKRILAIKTDCEEMGISKPYVHLVKFARAIERAHGIDTGASKEVNDE